MEYSFYIHNMSLRDFSLLFSFFFCNKLSLQVFFFFLFDNCMLPQYHRNRILVFVFPLSYLHSNNAKCFLAYISFLLFLFVYFIFFMVYFHLPSLVHLNFKVLEPGYIYPSHIYGLSIQEGVLVYKGCTCCYLCFQT